MNIYSWSLSKKAFLAVAIILLPILITFLIGSRSNKKQLEEIILNDLTVMAEAYEGQIYQFLEMSKRRAEDFASDGFINDRVQEIVNRKVGSAPALHLNQHLIRNKRPLDNAIRDIHILSLDGTIISSTNSSAISRNLSGEPFFINSKAETIVTEGNIMGQPALLISTPIISRTEMETIGILLNTVTIHELNKVLSGKFSEEMGAISVRKGRLKTTDIYLVNRDSLMVTDSAFIKDSILKQKVDTQPVMACLTANTEMSGFYKDYRGVDVAGAAMCFPSLKWTLLVEVDRDEVLAVFSKATMGALSTFILVAGLIGVLFIAFSRSVAAPLRKIIEASKDIARGNYNVTIPVKSRDEIGLLSETFNSMAGDIKNRTNMLKESEAGLANAQRIAHLGNWDWDIINNKLYWSDEIYRIFGLSPHEFGATYETFLNSVHPDDRELVNKAVDEALSSKKSYSIDHRIVLPSGRERIVHEMAEAAWDENGRPVRMTGTVQDITEQKVADMELKKLSAVIEHSVNIVFITDVKGNIEYVNSMFEKVTGWTKEEAIGQNPRILSSGKTPEVEYEDLWRTILAGKTWRGVVNNKKKDGHYYWVSSVLSPIKNERGEITHFLAMQEDISERKKMEERVQYLATYDSLTGLVNRAKFIESVDECLSRQPQTNKQAGILMLIGIDHFALINDTYGHGVGDRLLQSVADVLLSTLKGANRHLCKAIGRLGGDEFALFHPHLSPQKGMEEAEGIRKKIEEIRLPGAPVHQTASIGVVHYPTHGDTTKELLTMTDAAMRRAKGMGRNKCHFYRPEDKDLEKIHSRLSEKERIIKAISEDRFLPWFQPILGIKDGVQHYEALARLRDEEGNILSPAIFIDTAERFGLIGTIDNIIAEKTMRLQAEMGRNGKYLTFGMNLSGNDFGDEEFLSRLQSKILETKADPNHLIFEITETAAVHEMEKAKRFIKALKSMGCRFSLDDFGVGFTSFTYLKELDVDYIKIDGSFIRRLHENYNDQLFVKAIVDVARGMGIKTVAEFVESEETLQLLKEYGVDYAQGYLIGKPGPELLKD